MNQDEEHLKLLAIFHYVLGGLAILGGCFPFLWGLLMSSVFVAAASAPQSRGNGPPAEVGFIFMGIGIMIAVVVWALAGCMIYAARCLQTYRHRVFCIVVAALCCMHAPLGTVLGVFTLIVLMRPTVVDLFNGKQGGAHPLPPEY